jgi:competence protein ComEA
MLRIHRLIRDFFGFPRAQVNAFLVLLPLIAMAVFSVPVYRWWASSRPRDYRQDRAKLDSMIIVWEKGSPDRPGKQVSLKKAAFFRFDPNTISVAGMESLGFSAALSARIAHYREKGGKFRVRLDLRKIYGMDSAFYGALYPYIKLPESLPEAIGKNEPFKANKQAKKENLPFDLNLADTAQLKSIYGIGEKLSIRIMRYRDALGGFVLRNQLMEIYGLDSAVVKRLAESSFIDERFNPRRINVNTATERDLSIHPYLPVSAAKAIVSYRFQHGGFTSVEDLRKIPILDEKTIQKITPYLEFKN